MTIIGGQGNDPGGVRGVLFDVDGTLVDTNYLHTVCWAEALHQSGYDLGSARVHRAIGMGADELLDELLGNKRDRSADGGIKAAHRALYAQHWGHLRRLAGARELLAECAHRGLTVGLATSARADELRQLRDCLDAEDFIASATSSADVDAAKPRPDVLEVALENCGLAVDSAVFVGDTVWDAAAASRIGLRFVGVTSGGISDRELWAAGACEVYSSPAELLERLDESMLGRTVGARVSTVA